MNRRKFFKLFGGLLAALPFIKWFIPEQATELSSQMDAADIISYDNFAKDGYVVFFNMTAEQVAEAKIRWEESLNTQERGFFYRILTE